MGHHMLMALTSTKALFSIVMRKKDLAAHQDQHLIRAGVTNDSLYHH